MSCIACRYFRASPPEGWKPRYDGQRYDNYAARNTSKESGLQISGSCVLNPVWVPVKSEHHCGQFVHCAPALNPDEDNILDDFMLGTWEQRRLEELRRNNADLKKKLQAVRKISASRLARLQRADAS